MRETARRQTGGPSNGPRPMVRSERREPVGEAGSVKDPSAFVALESSGAFHPVWTSQPVGRGQPEERATAGGSGVSPLCLAGSFVA